MVNHCAVVRREIGDGDFFVAGQHLNRRLTGQFRRNLYRRQRCYEAVLDLKVLRGAASVVTVVPRDAREIKRPGIVAIQELHVITTGLQPYKKRTMPFVGRAAFSLDIGVTQNRADCITPFFLKSRVRGHRLQRIETQ